MPGRYPKVKESNRNYYLRNKETIAASRYAWAKARRGRILAAYGGCCACGATDNLRFEKTSTTPTEAVGLKRGVLDKWIIDNGFPQGFRLRCATCVLAQKKTPAEKCKSWRAGRSPEQVGKAKVSNVKSTARYRRNHPDRRLEVKRNRRAAKLSTGVVTKEDWDRVLEAADHKCVACASTRKLTMDHIVPLVKGGPHTVANIQPLCHSCNSKKNVKDHDYRSDEMLERLGLSRKEGSGEE